MRRSDIADGLVRVCISGETNFVVLAKLAKLEPSKDFMFADLSGSDLRGEDLRLFNFTGSVFDGSRIHGAMFNETVTPEQLVGANLRTYADVIQIGYLDSQVGRMAASSLSREFCFLADISSGFDEYRGQRNQLMHQTPNRSQLRLAPLIERLQAHTEHSDVLFIALATPSSSAADAALEIIDAHPRGQAFAFAFSEEADQRSRRRRFIRFKVPRVDPTWSSEGDLRELYRFLAATRIARVIDEVPRLRMRGSPEQAPIQPTITTIRSDDFGQLGDAIFASVTHMGWNKNLRLRLYVAEDVYDRRTILEGLEGKATGMVEFYTFAGARNPSQAAAYALLAHPDSGVWSAFDVDR